MAKKKFDKITKTARTAMAQPQKEAVVEEKPQEEVGSLLRLIRREKQKLSLAGRKIEILENASPEIEKASKKIYTPPPKE